MRLTCIQLAGFKSFVEPTALNFVANRTAIVGPNGCGKSNVIDAVRWVMGESSAKHLRGDAMTDVIFNGSASRRSHGMASVELVFDNSDKRLAGQYAALNSLSIKRRLSRDGDNQFFINGEKCRRRDVTDLFSGTGLGPRAYAIIEQGTIARLIDAKPDELRSFIEEAAGLSKYKERRRETATRIEHSRDNLARLQDIAQEVQQQIDRLSQQAQAAEQFRALKARIRAAQGQIKALQWQELQTALAAAQGQAETLLQQQASLEAQLAASLQQQQTLQEAQANGLAAQDAANGQVLALNQTIAQHLTATAHRQAQVQLWRQQELEVGQEVAQLARLLDDAVAEATSRQDQQQSLTASRAGTAASLAKLRAAEQQATTELLSQQQALSDLEAKLQAHKEEHRGLVSQQAQLAEQINHAAEQVAQRQAALSRAQQTSEEHYQGPEDQRELPTAADLLTQEQQLKGLIEERAALAAQQAAVAHQSAYLAGRLGRPSCAAAGVESALPEGPWQDTWAAAEAWLQPWISARPWAQSWEAATKEVEAPAFLIRPQADTLGIVQWLASWRSAADGAAALAALENEPGAVFYTPTGEVFARDWLYLPAPGQSRFSLPERLAQLAELTAQEQALRAEQDALDTRLTRQRADLALAQGRRLRAEAVGEFQQARLTAAEVEYQQAQNFYQERMATAAALADTLLRLEQSLHREQNNQLAINQQLAASQAQLTLLAAQVAEVSRADEQLHLQLQALQLTAEAAQPVRERLAEQHQRLALKQASLLAHIAQSQGEDEPLQRLQAELADALQALKALKEQYASGEKQLKSLLTQERQQRQQLDQLRLTMEANTLSANTLQTQLQGLQTEAFDINTALAMLPAHATGESLQQQLTDDKNALEALGPVNLAALEEYEQACARAAYLREQQTDLHQALECLENAIKQIDKESRQRFKNTFDGANEGLQALFPQVFEGGSANLELIGDDLLAAGVAIMARPPGKKNSTIHLLSGGEKALTALALVFALFRLNPAPFCLLDEVDAPLDDANVGRFARLVEAMAEQVQFIFITHNKIAMEMAEHLLGVTMQEPGVSRVVSVDIAHAAKLAAD